jgi:hypothetical protein
MVIHIGFFPASFSGLGELLGGDGFPIWRYRVVSRKAKKSTTCDVVLFQEGGQ